MAKTRIFFLRLSRHHLRMIEFLVKLPGHLFHAIQAGHHVFSAKVLHADSVKRGRKKVLIDLMVGPCNFCCDELHFGLKSGWQGITFDLTDECASVSNLSLFSNDVNLSVRFLGQLLELTEAVAAVIVFPVADDNEPLFVVTGIANLFKPCVNGIEKGSGAFRSV